MSPLGIGLAWAGVMMNCIPRLSVILLAAAWAGSALSSTGCATMEPETIALPVLDADSPDYADRGCRVVLREAGLLAGGTPVRTVNYRGANHFLYAAVVDVALEDVEAGAVVGLAGEPVVRTDPVEDSPAGFQRYIIEFVGPNTGTSGTSLNGTRMSIIPFVELAGGVRAWDHNRNHGDFDNYDIVRENSFKIVDDARICPASDATPTRWAAALTCDAGAMVLDVDRDDPTHFQLVARDLRAVDRLAEQASDLHGAVRFNPAPRELIAEGYGAHGGYEGRDFSDFETAPRFETLDIWAAHFAPTARVQRRGSEVHLTLLNTTSRSDLPRCSENRYAFECVVADWIFRDCY